MGLLKLTCGNGVHRAHIASAIILSVTQSGTAKWDLFNCWILYHSKVGIGYFNSASTKDFCVGELNFFFFLCVHGVNLRPFSTPKDSKAFLQQVTWWWNLVPLLKHIPETWSNVSVFLKLCHSPKFPLAIMLFLSGGWWCPGVSCIHLRGWRCSGIPSPILLLLCGVLRSYPRAGDVLGSSGPILGLGGGWRSLVFILGVLLIPSWGWWCSGIPCPHPRGWRCSGVFWLHPGAGAGWGFPVPTWGWGFLLPSWRWWCLGSQICMAVAGNGRSCVVVLGVMSVFLVITMKKCSSCKLLYIY